MVVVEEVDEDKVVDVMHQQGTAGHMECVFTPAKRVTLLLKVTKLKQRIRTEWAAIIGTVVPDMLGWMCNILIIIVNTLIVTM